MQKAKYARVKYNTRNIAVDLGGNIWYDDNELIVKGALIWLK
jgi:hypothetical protein